MRGKIESVGRKGCLHSTLVDIKCITSLKNCVAFWFVYIPLWLILNHKNAMKAWVDGVVYIPLWLILNVATENNCNRRYLVYIPLWLILNATPITAPIIVIPTFTFHFG